MPGPRVAVGFIGDKKPTRCMHFDTMPNQTPLPHKATSALGGSTPRQPVGKPVRGSKPEPPKIPSADQRGLSRARSMG